MPDLPERGHLPKPSQLPLQRVAVVVLRHHRRVLARPRPTSDTLLAGLWEFPGGKIEGEESAEEAARRELREETALDCGPLRIIAVERHDYADRALEIHFFVGNLLASPQETLQPVASPWCWRALSDLTPEILPAANHRIVQQLQQNEREE